ncbi:MAG: CoA transferase subunit A [Candidatus Saccharimonadaceae bacterium]
MSKLTSYADAISKLKDGMTIMIGGFLSNGTPERLVDELVKSGVKDLTLIVNDTAFPDKGCGKLIVNKQIKKLIVSHIGTNPFTEDQMNKGELMVEFSPQGTLAERIRAGGAGLGGVLSPTGVGTVVAEGKQLIDVDNKQYILEKPLRADVALIKGSMGDRLGNLIYMGTTQNFNPLMATAADLVIAEVDTLQETGDFTPETVHTPFIFVDYIVNGNKE